MRVHHQGVGVDKPALDPHAAEERAVRDAGGDVAWMRGTGAGAVDQQAVDTYVARQVKFDPDLWVLEFEAPDMLPPFEAKLM